MKYRFAVRIKYVSLFIWLLFLFVFFFAYVGKKKTESFSKRVSQLRQRFRACGTLHKRRAASFY